MPQLHKHIVSERYLQCSANRNRCIVSDDGIRRLSLKQCIECKYSLITDKPFCNYPSKKVKYEKDKDNWTNELEKRLL